MVSMSEFKYYRLENLLLKSPLPLTLPLFSQAQAPGRGLQLSCRMGLAVLWRVGSSWPTGGTSAAYVSGWILIHCTSQILFPYYKLLCRLRWPLQWVLVGYLFYICVPALFCSICPGLGCPVFSAHPLWSILHLQASKEPPSWTLSLKTSLSFFTVPLVLLTPFPCTQSCIS